MLLLGATAAVAGAGGWWSWRYFERHGRMPWEKPEETETAPATPAPPQAARGLVLQLFAESPQVANPTAISLDEQGRLYVAESGRWTDMWNLSLRGQEYWLLDDLACQSLEDRLRMYEKWQHRFPTGMAIFQRGDEQIRRLEDTDGDGRADRSVVFANGFNDTLTSTAEGVLAEDGKVFFACLPRLWELADTDGDGKADERRVLLEGFGLAFSLAHDLHGLIRGPDGRLYFSLGDRGYRVTTSGGKVLFRPHTGAVFRCHPDGTELEAIAHGLRNPYELAFDDFGNLFTVDNNSLAGGRSRLIYVVEGAEYGWHMSYETWRVEEKQSPWMQENLWANAGEWQPAWVLPGSGDISGGPAGLAHYPGVGLDERHRGRFFLCDFQASPEASGILSFAVSPQGAGFVLKDARDVARFLVPTDLSFGCDGRMYVADWVEGWNGRGQGRIFTIHDPAQVNSAAVKEVQQLFREGFAERGTPELIALLGHADQRVRQRAQFALADRGPDAIAPLQASARSHTNLLARLHALWGLGMVARAHPKAVEGVVVLLDDREAEVRAQTAKVLGEALHSAAASKLMARLKDEDARVRFFAAMALGKLRHRPALESLLAMLGENADRDRFLRHAGVMALASLNDADALLAHADDANTSVRLAVVLALRRRADVRIARFLNDHDPRIVAEAARAIHDAPIEPALPELAALIGRRDLDDWVCRRVLNANFRAGTPAHARALMQVALDAERPEPIRLEALGALAEWGRPSPRDRMLGVHRPLPPRDTGELEQAIAPWLSQLLHQSEGDLRNAAVRVASRLRFRDRDTDFAAWVADAQKPAQTRVEALRLLAGRKDDTLASALEAALKSKVPELQVEAAEILGAADPRRAAQAWTNLLSSPSLFARQKALAALAQTDAPEAEIVLKQWMGRLADGSVPEALMLDVIEAARGKPALQAAVNSFEADMARSGEAKRRQPLLAGGDAERGRAVFDRPTLQCRRCHRIDGAGGAMGPDLSRIGADKTPEHLLESLLRPGQTIAEGFASATIALRDGTLVTGVIREETETHLRVVDMGGNTQTVSKADIERRTPGQSPMPENIVESLTPFELRDLVAFLASLKGR